MLLNVKIPLNINLKDPNLHKTASKVNVYLSFPLCSAGWISGSWQWVAWPLSSSSCPWSPVLLSTYCHYCEAGRAGGGGALLGTLCSACLDKHANKHINIQLGIFHAPWASEHTAVIRSPEPLSQSRGRGRKVPAAIGNFLLERCYISWRGWKMVEVGLAGKCGKWQYGETCGGGVSYLEKWYERCLPPLMITRRANQLHVSEC